MLRTAQRFSYRATPPINVDTNPTKGMFAVKVDPRDDDKRRCFYLWGGILAVFGQALTLFGSMILAVELAEKPTSAGTLTWTAIVAFAGLVVSYSGQSLRDDADHPELSQPFLTWPRCFLRLVLRRRPQGAR